MFLQYNGVNLELVSLDHVERTGVYSTDGMDLLFVHWIIGATCVFSPGGYPVGTAATSLSTDTTAAVVPSSLTAAGINLHGTNTVVPAFTQEANVVGSFGPAAGGVNAIQTDAELKNRLYIPRKKLFIWGFDDQTGFRTIWLESPKGSLACDINGGPKPLALDVVSATGEGLTFGVHFQIETWQSPCPSKADRLLLSHRWQMQHTHDTNNYLTRIIDGEAVFNQAFIQSTGAQPDLIRNQLYHPIPLGFQRTLGPITQSSDGATIRYQILDTDTTITFDPGDSGATQMEIVENLSYTQPWRFIGGGTPVGSPFVPWWGIRLGPH